MFNYKKRIGIIANLLCIALLGMCIYVPNNKSSFANAEQKSWDYEDCENIITFVNNNLTTFVSEYNKTVEDGNILMASYIEYSSVINLYEDENYGAYIDFNGNNGYVVVTGDYNIYKLEVKGDLSFLRTQKNIWYSHLDGFFYYGEDGLPYKLNLVENETYHINYVSKPNGPDGQIDPLKFEQYVADNYPDYELVSKNVGNISATFPFSKQFDTSYYIKRKYDNSGNYIGRTGEGNCALNTMYSLLLDWYNRGYIRNIPTATAKIYIKSDTLYTTYGTGIKHNMDGGSYYWEPNDSVNLDNMPILYSEIRDYVIKVHGYTPESGYPAASAQYTMKYIANILHGNDITITGLGILSNAITYLRQNKSCFLSIIGSSTYENHAVALLGRYEYSYKSGWWIFSSKKFAYFYEIADGWNATPVFFDPNTSANPELTVYYLE